MSDNFDFDFGMEEGLEVKSSGKAKNTKVPSAGDHEARIRSIVHMGMVEDEHEGVSKGIHPKIVIVFELKEEDDFEDDGVTPLTVSKDIFVKKGDKSALSALVRCCKKADGTTAKNLNELIGTAVNVTVRNSKCGNYANVPAFTNGGVSAIGAKYLSGVAPLVDGLGVGHVLPSQITEKAILECHSWNHIADIMMQSVNYEGSKFQEVIEQIRSQEGREDFAKKVKKSNKPKAAAPELSDDEEF